jgi:hydroxymethylpyrimidine/phosphomethylpyrimidine kinase
MKEFLPILSITGSDSTGGSGIQADIKTIYSLGGYAVTAITAITVQNTKSISSFQNIDAEMVIGQIKPVFEEVRPKAVKIGLIREVKTVKIISKEIVRCSNIVVDAGFISSRGEKLVSDDVVKAFEHYIFPQAKILIIKIQEAEMLTGKKIISTDDMQLTALELLKSGAQSVLLQGGHCAQGIVTDIFVSQDCQKPHYFTSPDTRGWSFHGVVGTLSSAAATFLAKGEIAENAAVKAHEYIRSLIAYSVGSDTNNIIRHTNNNSISSRNIEIYNLFMSLVAKHFLETKEVKFYADKLSITPRYLSQITRKVTGKTPKHLIDSYIMKEIEELLLSTALTIQQIAYKLGFISETAFCKYFKSQRKISPQKFRTQNKNL